MRTRKHRSPVEPSWVDKNVCEDGAGLACDTQPTLVTKGSETPNGVSQAESTDTSLNTEQKKINGKKQKRRRRSPKNKSPLPNAADVLLGLMADAVWLDKPMYDDAECTYHARLAAQPDKTPETSSYATGSVNRKHKGAGDAPRKAVAQDCSHNSAMACHHVSDGVWINKVNFDYAESQFVMHFSSPLAARPLNLNLVSAHREVQRSAQRTPDEGYASTTPTPAAQAVPTFPEPVSDPTVNGKPHWAGLQDLIAEVWLEKASFDQAERNFYEHIAGRQSELQEEQNFHWSLNARKKNKRDKWNRKAPVRPLPSRKKKLSSIPEEAAMAPYYPACFLHADSEPVWLDRGTYDQAEAGFYTAQDQAVPSCAVKSNKSSVAKLHRPCDKKMAASFLSTEKIWLDRYKYDDAERQYYERLSGSPGSSPQNQTQEDGASTILRDIARARENIQKSLAGSTSAAPCNSEDNGEVLARVASLEQENQSLHKVVLDLQQAISKLESRITTLENSAPTRPPVCKLPAPVPAPSCPVKAPELKKVEEDEDDDIDLFGSDEEEEDANAAKIKEERIRQYAEKKSKKPGLIAKSSILLDVKPWDDETDMAKLEACVRTVQMDGLLWGSSKLVPVGYGIKKLQIQCVVEDDKVGTDTLEEEITKFEDYVQSVDIAAFNKI